MSSHCRDLLTVMFSFVLLALAGQSTARDLVVCADPDNLPYSRADESGLENRIARLVADEIGAELHYRWQPLRRGVVRKTLDARACDMLAGVPSGMEGVATTSAYYRSGYVFVYRRDETPPIESFDDPRLETAAIGVQLVGADMAATPAALALVRRGIVANVIGFPVYGAEPAAQRMIEDVDGGRLDVAIVWGPQAGYFVQHARAPLALSLARDEGAAQPLDFAIAIGVRQDDIALRGELDLALERARDRVGAILAEFGVPQVVSPPIDADSSR